MAEVKYIVPPVDIYETPDKYLILMDMPGVNKDKIDITVEDDKLTVTAKVFEIDKEWEPISTEFTLSDYKREFNLGRKVNTDKISANYENGILKLELEKSEMAKPRKIEVKAG
jgi:HSP20 family molecular chaperone IbpA